MLRRRSSKLIVMLSAAALLVAASVGATSPARAADAPRIGPDPQQYREVVNKGLHYLQTKGQADDGSFSAKAGPGLTALVVTSMLKNGQSVDEPSVAKGLTYLKGFVQKTGGIHAPDSLYKNYETSIAVMCFASANKDHRYDKIINDADGFLKGLQNTEGGDDKKDPAYGGVGYGRNKRPDLSNTAMFLDALIAAGKGPDDEAVQRAIIFVSRCQNLETVHNDTKWAVKNPDGGFYYTAAAGGGSEAKWDKKDANETRGLRSYGSMTYAGLKSLIYAGLKSNDPRVVAATDWIRKNYSVDENPGVGQQGLFYYYNTFGKTLSVLGQDEITDMAGKKHDWRKELVEKLAKLQGPDGAWVNKADRWMESDPNLVTGFALLALSYSAPPASK
ncbi:MAG: terpene cyclase/mutase family protein [Planctomycetia bacterium]|nr:terpene cyclase/mutase family protein [Planctomycetia bacterium]